MNLSNIVKRIELLEKGLNFDKDTGFVFHGTFNGNLKLSKMRITSFNSMGIWVSNDPEYAADFGKYVYKMKINSGVKFFKNLSGNFDIDFFDFDVSKKVHGKDVAGKLADAIDNSGKIPSALAQEMIFNNVKYLSAFMSNLKKLGFGGMFWKNKSIDTKTLKDVWLVFNHSDIKIIDKRVVKG